MGEMKWYAVRVVTGKEKSVRDSLEKELEVEGLSKYVNQIVLPTENEIKLKNGKKFTREKITFPGYILLEADLVGELPKAIRNFKNVAGFTTDTKNGNPVALKQYEVDRILGRIEEKSSDIDILIAGESVNIIDGPFAGFKGCITSIDMNSKKLKVDVPVFGRNTNLELSLMQIEKVMD